MKKLWGILVNPRRVVATLPVVLKNRIDSGRDEMCLVGSSCGGNRRDEMLCLCLCMWLCMGLIIH